MKKILSAKLAGRILIGAFILMLIMHVLVLIGVMPSNFIWGGQVAADGSNLLQLEVVAITLTLFFTGVAAAKIK